MSQSERRALQPDWHRRPSRMPFGLVDFVDKVLALRGPVLTRERIKPIIWKRLRFTDFKCEPDAYDVAVEAIADELLGKEAK